MFVSQSDKEKNFSIPVLPKILCRDKVEWVWEEQETLAKQLWALHYKWWDPEVGPVLQRAYKIMRELKILECAIFKRDTLRSSVLRNLLKNLMNIRV